MTLPELIAALSQIQIDAPHDIFGVSIVDERISFDLTLHEAGRVQFTQNVRISPRIDRPINHTYRAGGGTGGGGGNEMVNINSGGFTDCLQCAPGHHRAENHQAK